MSGHFLHLWTLCQKNAPQIFERQSSCTDIGPNVKGSCFWALCIAPILNPFMPTSTFLYIFFRKIKSRPILKILGRVHVWWVPQLEPCCFVWLAARWHLISISWKKWSFLLLGIWYFWWKIRNLHKILDNLHTSFVKIGQAVLLLWPPEGLLSLLIRSN